MSDRKAILAKIKALLAKTVENGCTEAEALAALGKASDLMAAHDVSDADLSFGGEAVEKTERRREATEDLLAVGVAAFCECRTWVDPANIVFLGLESDVILATWLLDTLAAFVKRHAIAYAVAQAPRHRVDGLRAARGFTAGCVRRIQERLLDLARQRRMATSGSNSANALIVAKSALIAAEMAKRGIVVRASRGGSRTVDGRSYAAGRAAGDGARFDTPLRGGAPLAIGAR